MARASTRRSRKRAVAHVLLSTLLVVPILMTGGTDAGAVHDTAFELEGDVGDDPVGSPFDWASFFGNDGAPAPVLPDASRPGFVDSGFDADHAFPDLSTYTGGSKDTLDVSGWSCTDSNNLGGKFDIVNAYSTIYEDAGTGDLLLLFGIERAATEGDGNMGFWFLKDGSVDCEKTQKGQAPAFNGNHQDGDIFVVASFSNGGTQAAVTAYQWEGGSDGFLDVDNPFVSGAKCAPGTHDACGVVNEAPLTTPWSSPDKNGGPLDTNAFYEGFVRLPASQVTGCFSTFVANTRSSTSPTATIHDFSRGSFPRCQPGTELKLKQYAINTGTPVPTDSATPSTIELFKGDSLELVFAEKNDGNFPLTKPTVGRYVVIPNTTQAGACALTDVLTGAVNSGDVNSNNVLDPDETWLYTCTISAGDTTPTQYVAYGHGIDSVTSPPTVKDVTACTTPESNNPVLAPATVATCDADEVTTVNLNILAPSTQMFASATADIIFYEKNDSNASLSRPGDGDFVRQFGTACDTFAQVPKVAPADTSKNVGDTNDNGLLDTDEVWQWKCTVTIGSSTTTSATETAEAIGHGINGVFDVTFCDSPGVARQAAKLSDNTTPATPICDADERRKVTLTIE